jgi:hypothetical protein
MHATCPAHLILLDGNENKTRSSSLCNFLHSSVTLSLLCWLNTLQYAVTAQKKKSLIIILSFVALELITQMTKSH